MRTIASVDADLIRTTDAFKVAVDGLDGDAADVLLDEINELLDERIALPVQRLPSERDGHASPGKAY